MVLPRHFPNDSRLVRMAYGLPGPWIYGYPLKHLLDGGWRYVAMRCLPYLPCVVCRMDNKAPATNLPSRKQLDKPFLSIPSYALAATKYVHVIERFWAW